MTAGTWQLAWQNNQFVQILLQHNAVNIRYKSMQVHWCQKSFQLLGEDSFWTNSMVHQNLTCVCEKLIKNKNACKRLEDPSPCWIVDVRVTWVQAKLPSTCPSKGYIDISHQQLLFSVCNHLTHLKSSNSHLLCMLIYKN